LTSSLLNFDEACSVNAALLNELMTGNTLSTRGRNYAEFVGKSERMRVRNVIIEEEHKKLKAVVAIYQHEPCSTTTLTTLIATRRSH
jgi:hypothetical protein